MDVRPPMPGPGYIWIDGYENEFGQFMPGYWALPPYAGSFWVAPRLFSGRWVAGYWGGSRGFVGGEFREGFHDRDFHDRDFGDRGFRDGGFRPGGFREAPHAEFRGGNQSFRVNSAPSFQGGGHSGGSPRGGFSQGNSSQGGHGRR